jgi:hypothetical protein
MPRSLAGDFGPARQAAAATSDGELRSARQHPWSRTRVAKGREGDCSGDGGDTDRISAVSNRYVSDGHGGI